MADNVATDAPVKKTRDRKKKTADDTGTTDNTTTTPAEILETFKLQFGSAEYGLNNIKDAVMADIEVNARKATESSSIISSIDYYIKPEDKAVYYVVRFEESKEYSGKVALGE